MIVFTSVRTNAAAIGPMRPPTPPSKRHPAEHGRGNAS